MIHFSLDLEHSLNSLTPKHRRLIRMYFLEGYTYDELSRLYEVSYQTMWLRVQAALGSLQKLYNVQKED